MKYLLAWGYIVLGFSGLASNIVEPGVSRMAELFREYFSSPRPPSSSSHLATQNFITKELRSYGLEVHLQPFNTSMQGVQMKGTNVIGVLKGKFWNSTYDRILVIAAHYDTEENQIGVDDNGSGVVVVLEVARLLTIITAADNNCELQYSVMFVAFDCGIHDFNRDPSELKGSSYFIADWLEPIHLWHTTPSFIGAFILDSVLVWNNTVGSQILPDGFQRMFPSQWHQIQQSGFRGDFLAMINRGVPDDCLTTLLLHCWPQESQEKIPLFNLHLDLDVIPIPPVALEFMKQDHVEFWNAEVGDENAPLSAVLLTDTGVWRSGRGRECNRRCDSLDQVTDETLAFLSLIIRSLVNLITESHCIETSQNIVSSLGNVLFPTVFILSFCFISRWML